MLTLNNCNSCFQAWMTAKGNEDGLIHETEKFFKCCGYDLDDQNNLTDPEKKFCTSNISSCDIKAGTKPPGNSSATGVLSDTCVTCKELLDDKIDKGFNAAGGLGLFFALTEVSCRKIDSYF